MGTDNADLIRALEAARKRGDKAEYNRLSPLVRRSQEQCAHLLSGVPLDMSHPSGICDKDSKHGRYKRGDLLTYCRACSKILAINGHVIDPLEDAAWAKLHPDKLG